MLTKDQALAAMDAQIVRVRAERQWRLERRVGRLAVVYPALKPVPLEKRAALLEEVNRYAVRRWTVYASAVLVIALMTWSLLTNTRGASAMWPLLAFVVVRLVIYLHARSYLNRVVPRRGARVPRVQQPP